MFFCILDENVFESEIFSRKLSLIDGCLNIRIMYWEFVWKFEKFFRVDAQLSKFWVI